MAVRDFILSFKIKLFGVKGVRRRLKKLKKITRDFSPVARRIVTQLLKEADKPFVASARGNPPKTWKRLSVLTVFIRMHRARRKNRDPKIMVDSGLLRAMNLPFIRRGGREFGIENRHPAAKILHNGGTSRGNTVSISGFRRSKPSGGTSRVRPYSMSIKGGHRIPARPWMPTKARVLQILKIILGDYENRIKQI